MNKFIFYQVNFWGILYLYMNQLNSLLYQYDHNYLNLIIIFLKQINNYYL